MEMCEVFVIAIVYTKEKGLSVEPKRELFLRIRLAAERCVRASFNGIHLSRRRAIFTPMAIKI